MRIRYDDDVDKVRYLHTYIPQLELRPNEETRISCDTNFVEFLGHGIWI